MRDLIRSVFNQSSALKARMASDQQLLAQVEQAALQLIKTVNGGGTIYSCGNGGSACDAMHFTEELIARFKRDRRGIKALHMLDPGTLTCWTNDYSFETVFERYVRTFCTNKDTLVAFSTSGQSANVTNAVKAASETNTFSIGLLGKDGGKLKSLCNVAIIVPEILTERIQEAHIMLVHTFCELIETSLV